MPNYWKFSSAVKGNHVHVQVRCGPTTEHRPLLGTLIMSLDEWSSLCELVATGVSFMPGTNVEVETP